MNCLYSMGNDFDYRRYQYQRPRPCNATPAATMIAASIMRIASFILLAGRAKHLLIRAPFKVGRRYTGKKEATICGEKASSCFPKRTLMLRFFFPPLTLISE